MSEISAHDGSVDRRPAPPVVPSPNAGASEGPSVAIELVPVTERVKAAVLTLNRPETLNAINWQVVTDLDHALRAAEGDDTVCAVLITGRGRAFSAGGDLRSYLTLQADPPAFQAFVRDFHRTFASIRVMRKPVVALVNGVTAAGGLELMLACDFAYAAASAQIGDLHLNYGQIGGGGVLALLPRAIGPAKARELVLSAEMLDAHQALSWGLVNRVVDDDALLEAGLKLARGIAEKSPIAVAVAKDVMNRGFADGTGVAEALRLEADATSLYCASHPDSMEGLRAFAEKRKPRFKGR